jgi:hypothetical protein
VQSFHELENQKPDAVGFFEAMDSNPWQPRRATPHNGCRCGHARQHFVERVASRDQRQYEASYTNRSPPCLVTQGAMINVQEVQVSAIGTSAEFGNMR